MIRGSSLKEGDKEDSKNNNNNNNTKPSSSNPSSWLRLKDPRIVRVSRAFGGKDRHSKVCTVRGLRDRRVRLSVPTAIQLYDLQDRLGLSQPSKVVDWLLNAAKDEIDELPPLQMPPISFPRSHEQEGGVVNVITNADSQSGAKEGIKINQHIDWNEEARSSTLWNANWRGKAKEVVEVVATQNNHGKENPQSNNSSFLNIGHNVPYWEPSNFPYGLMSQLEDVRHNNVNNVPLPSALSLSSSTTQPYSSFPFEIDPRQFNHFQMLSSSQNHSLVLPQSVRPFHFSMSAPRPPQNNDGSEQIKDQEHQ